MSENHVEETISEEELLELMSQIKGEGKSEIEMFREPFEYDIDSLEAISQTDEFKRGSTIASYYAGIYSTLLNFGMDIKSAHDIVINQQSLDANEKIQKMSVEMNIEVSKNQSLAIERNQL